MPQLHTPPKNFVRVHNKFMVCIQNNHKFHKLCYAFNIYIIGNDNDDNADDDDAVDAVDDDGCDGGGDDMRSYEDTWHSPNEHLAICK